MNTFLEQFRLSIIEFVNAKVNSKTTGSDLIFCCAEKIDGIKITQVLNYDKIKNKNLFYFAKPDEKFEWLAIDQLVTLNKQNENSFESVLENYSSLKEKFRFNKIASEIISIPSFQCYMKFDSKNTDKKWDEFQNFSFTIPKILLLNDNNHSYLILFFHIVEELDFTFIEKLIDDITKINSEKIKTKTTHIIDQDSNEEKDKLSWNNLLENGKELLNEGELQKFVLSRKKEFILSNDPDYCHVIDQLNSRYPNCFIFLVMVNEHVFFGASPESFMKSRNDELVFEAVAGTVPRGNHIDEELSFEKRLLLDPKLKSEHQIVKDFIFENVSMLSEGIKPSEKSFIRKLDNIQHLVTIISVTPKNNVSIFKYIDRLFPTPAVCGVPSDKAAKIISTLELHSRGLYSGLLGWFDIDLNGELVVGIRSALSEGNKITAFAGGGILKDSDAEEEFFETQLKFQPILSLFNNEEKS